MQIKPITPIHLEDFFTKNAILKLEKNICTQYDRNIQTIKYFCLVGRHKILSQKERFRIGSGLPAIERTTEYGYQGCYIPLCENCYRKYKRIERISLATLILFGIGILGIIASVIIYLIFKTIISFGGLSLILFMTMPLAFWITHLFLTSDQFSRNVVITNEEFSGIGVPDISDSRLPIVGTEKELKEL